MLLSLMVLEQMQGWHTNEAATLNSELLGDSCYLH